MPAENPPSQVALTLLERARRVAVHTIIEDPENVNEHSDRNLRDIEASFRSHSQQEFLVVREVDEEDRARWPDQCTAGVEFISVSGAGRLTVVRERLGWREVDIVVFDGDKRAAKAYAIKANQTARTSQFNWEKLARQLVEFEQFEGDAFKSTDFGFEEFEYNPLKAAVMGDGWTKQTGKEQGGVRGGAPLEDGDRADKADPIFVTPNQRGVFELAAAHIRADEGDDSITEGRLVELLSLEFLSGVGVRVDTPQGAQEGAS
jgi:hypothetical protein